MCVCQTTHLLTKKWLAAGATEVAHDPYSAKGDGLMKGGVLGQRDTVGLVKTSQDKNVAKHNV